MNNDVPILSPETKKNSDTSKSYFIPFVKATAETLDGYGEVVQLENSKNLPIIRILQWPGPGKRGVMGGTEGSVQIQELEIKWENDGCFCKTTNCLEQSSISSLVCVKDNDSIMIHEAVANLNSEKLIVPQQSVPYVMVLSKNFNDETVSPCDFVAFFFDGGSGLILNPGVWHQPPISQDTSRFFCKQPQISELIKLDFCMDFNTMVCVKDPFCPPSAEQVEDFYPNKKLLNLEIVDPPVTMEQSKSEEKEEFVQLQKLPLQLATADNFMPYGRLIESIAPDDSEFSVLTWPGRKRTVYHREKPAIVGSRFCVEWDHATDSAHNELIFLKDGQWHLGGCTFNNALYHVDKLYAQIASSYAMLPLKTASFVVVVASQNKLGEPIKSSVRAFLICPENGIILHPGIWHSQPIPSNQCKQLPFMAKHAVCNARSEFSSFEEWKQLISVQLSEECK